MRFYSAKAPLVIYTVKDRKETFALGEVFHELSVKNHADALIFRTTYLHFSANMLFMHKRNRLHEFLLCRLSQKRFGVLNSTTTSRLERERVRTVYITREAT